MSVVIKSFFHLILGSSRYMSQPISGRAWRCAALAPKGLRCSADLISWPSHRKGWHLEWCHPRELFRSKYCTDLYHVLQYVLHVEWIGGTRNVFGVLWCFLWMVEPVVAIQQEVIFVSKESPDNNTGLRCPWSELWWNMLKLTKPTKNEHAVDLFHRISEKCEQLHVGCPLDSSRLFHSNHMGMDQYLYIPAI